MKKYGVFAACFCAALCYTFPVFSSTVKQNKKVSGTLSSTAVRYPVGADVLKLPVFVSGVTPASASRLPAFTDSIRDFSTNLTIKDKTELKKLRPATFQEAVRDVAGGIFFDQVGNGVDETFDLRGFSEGSDLIFLVDGVRVNEIDGSAVNFPLIAAENIESIEIAPGSSSAVYGSGAFAGVINVKTRKPSSKPVSFFGGAEWTSFRGIRFFDGVSGSVSDSWTPLDGKMTYYLNAGRNQARGFRANGEWRITSFNIKLGYQLPEDSGGVQFLLKHTDDATSNPGALTLDEFRQNWRQSKQKLDGRKFHNTIVQLQVNKKFLDRRLNVSLQGSIRPNQIRFLTTSRTFTDSTTGANPDTDLVTTRSREKNVTAQMTYEQSWGPFHSESLIGTELDRAFEHDTRQEAFGGNVVEAAALENKRSAEITNFGLFWNERLHVRDWLVAHAGFRGDYFWTAVVDNRNHANDLNRRWRKGNWSTGFVIRPVRRIDLFWNFSQAFRVPALSDLRSFSGDATADLDPERADSFETGIRVINSRKLSAKMSYFEIITRDEITFDNSAVSAINPFGRNVNAGKTRRNGVEIRVDMHPREEVALFGTYAYTRARVRKTVDDALGSFSQLANRSLGLVPSQRFSAGMTVRPLQRFGPPYDQFEININGVWTGRQHIQSFESTQQSLLNAAGGMIKPYHVWNLKTSFEWRGKEIYLKVNNLFDARYFSRAVAATSFGTASTPPGSFLFVNPAPPREFLIGVRYQFA